MISKRTALQIGQSASKHGIPAFDHFVKQKAAAEVKSKQKRGEAPQPDPGTVASQMAVDLSKAVQPAYESYVQQKAS
jgi:hypothetical protein